MSYTFVYRTFSPFFSLFSLRMCECVRQQQQHGNISSVCLHATCEACDPPLPYSMWHEQLLMLLAASLQLFMNIYLIHVYLRATKPLFFSPWAFIFNIHGQSSVGAARIFFTGEWFFSKGPVLLFYFCWVRKQKQKSFYRCTIHTNNQVIQSSAANQCCCCCSYWFL